MAIDQWLIRTSQNLITGPFPLAQVRQMVQDGELGLQDEVCSANDYWFYLHEREEVRRFLGIEVPKQIHRSEDQTQTETALDGERTDPDLPRLTPATEPLGLESQSDGLTSMVNNTVLTLKPASMPIESSELAIPFHSLSGNSPFPVSEGALTELPPKVTRLDNLPNLEDPELTAHARAGRPPIFSPIESSSIWRGAVWILLAIAVGVVVAVMRLLKS